MEKTLDDYKPATIDQLADALDALVTELVRYRKLRQVQAENEEWPSEPFRLVSFATLTKVPNDVLRQRSSIVENPVERALKHGMVEVGKLMYANLKIHGQDGSYRGGCLRSRSQTIRPTYRYLGQHIQRNW